MEQLYNIKIAKVLSRNDTGETHSHQSGISIPKKVAKSGIFPELGTDKLNPRVDIQFYDENNKLWTFQYIYYNDVFFGKPSSKAHNEFRLTCVKDFIRENNIKSGDSIWFMIDPNGVRHLGFDKINESKTNIQLEDGAVVLKLSSSWTYVKY